MESAIWGLKVLGLRVQRLGSRGLGFRDFGI